MQVCSPEGYVLSKNVTVGSRPQSLSGLRIGLLDNTKPPVDKILPHIGERIRAQLPDVELFYISKKRSFPGAPSETLSALKENADVVINALGD